MTPRRAILSRLLLAGVLLPATPPLALAQINVDPSAASGRHGGGRRSRGTPSAAPPQGPQLKPDPAQRLDPGAVLCRTETDLRQHQAAITARLDGRDAADAPGCHLVRTMTPVDVVERHGPASTEVRLPGPPEQVGWTDAVVREAASAAR